MSRRLSCSGGNNHFNENSPPNELKLNADLSIRETNNCLNQIERIRRAIFGGRLALVVFDDLAEGAYALRVDVTLSMPPAAARA